MAWYKLPEELLELDLPYSAMILAAILYDADRNNKCVVTIRQCEIAKTMRARPNTISTGIRRLEDVGIILSHKSIGDATEITLKPGVIPPRQSSGQASRRKASSPPQPSQSSLNIADAEKLINKNI